MELNSGKLEVDCKDDNGPADQGVKWVAWGIGICVLAIAAIVSLVLYFSTGRNPTKPRIPVATVLAAGKTDQPVVYKTAAPAPHIGRCKIMADRVWNAPVTGLCFNIKPVDERTEYDKYVDGEYLCHIGPYGKVSNQVRPMPATFSTLGYKLSPGQGKWRLFIWVRYAIDAQPDDLWYARGVQTFASEVERNGNSTL